MKALASTVGADYLEARGATSGAHETFREEAIRALAEDGNATATAWLLFHGGPGEAMLRDVANAVRITWDTVVDPGAFGPEEAARLGIGRGQRRGQVA